MAFLDLVTSRQGHFRLESGYHAGLWMDLEALFAEPARVRPLVERLADSIRPYGAAIVCGPLLGGAFLAQAVASILHVEFAFTERRAPARPDGLYGVRYVLPSALRERVAGAGWRSWTTWSRQGRGPRHARGAGVPRRLHRGRRRADGAGDGSRRFLRPEGRARHLRGGDALRPVAARRVSACAAGQPLDEATPPA